MSPVAALARVSPLSPPAKTRSSAAVRPASSSPPPSPPEPIDLAGLEHLSGRELDALGMGRYQWYVWSLCGFGYFLDLLWAQAFGLVLGPLQQELGFSDGQSGKISTSFNAGLTAGSFFWGFTADIVGAAFFPPLPPASPLGRRRVVPPSSPV